MQPTLCKITAFYYKVLTVSRTCVCVFKLYSVLKETSVLNCIATWTDIVINTTTEAFQTGKPNTAATKDTRLLREVYKPFAGWVVYYSVKLKRRAEVTRLSWLRCLGFRSLPRVHCARAHARSVSSDWTEVGSGRDPAASPREEASGVPVARFLRRTSGPCGDALFFFFLLYFACFNEFVDFFLWKSKEKCSKVTVTSSLFLLYPHWTFM